ncbi:MAG TPA: sigma-54-dependent Fis family transcriptional regulator [Candidatus Hydrogenedentes bacterium]|nr:sigma-54-dependent Fis family transcriptional regulator [Candidatus Hydrogenedentota bacterium]
MQDNACAVLIVDDEREAIEGCQFTLEANGITNTVGCDDSRQVLALFEERNIGVVLLDLSMPHISGEDLLERIHNRFPDLPVIVVTALDEVSTAVRCMRAGAFDYMVKPVEESRLVAGVRHAIDLCELRREYGAFRRRVLHTGLQHPEAFAEIITQNSIMQAVFQYVETIARTDKPVLITGETGVGKELIARALHRLSKRPGNFVAVNVAGLDDNMFADSLFGHLKGAFTSAESAREGLIMQASEGTLFLDEIGDLSQASQVKILRLVQEREYFPVGADMPRASDARLLLATNRDVQALQEAGTFRVDLYYRLQTHQVHVPPLRERMNDLPLLLNHFLGQTARALNKKKPTPPPELLTLLSTYDFPGNVRELESMVFDAVSQHTARMLSMDTFKAHVERNRTAQPECRGPGAEPHAASPFALFDRLPTLREGQRQLIAEAMRRAKGNQTLAAQLLGITRSGLSKALKRSRETD